MKKLFFGSLMLLASFVVAVAAPQCTLEFEGATWTVTGGDDNGAPITANMMTPGFGKFCPQHVVKLEPAKPGSKIFKTNPMTAEQIFRGDTRKHVVCDRSVPIAPPQADAAPTMGNPAAAQLPRQQSHTAQPRWNPNRIIPASNEEDL